VIFFAAGALVVLDQIIKNRVYQKGGFFNWRDFFEIGYYQNYGTAFGIPVPYPVLYPLIIAALVILFIRYSKYVRKSYLWASLAFMLVLGGAVSNIIDRIKYGFVVD
jgi:lipoprotein signal peptidase